MNIIRIQKNLHEEMMAINPKTPFPDSLKLETITKFYYESILHRQKTSTIWNRTINTSGTCNDLKTIQF